MRFDGGRLGLLLLTYFVVRTVTARGMMEQTPSSPEKRSDNGRSDSSLQLEGKITVIALTQFGFLALGIASLKILIHSVSSVPPSIQWLDVISLWLFSIPVIWSVYATISVRRDKPPLSPFVARIAG